MSQAIRPTVGVSISLVELACLQIPIQLHSKEAQRAFQRGTPKLQDRLHSIMYGIPRQSDRQVADVLKRIRGQLDKSAEVLNSVVLETSNRVTNAGVPDLGISRSTPPVSTVKVYTPHARRYLELLDMYDLVILNLEKMIQFGLVSMEVVGQAKATAKDALRYVDNLVRDLAPCCAKSKK